MPSNLPCRRGMILCLAMDLRGELTGEKGSWLWVPSIDCLPFGSGFLVSGTGQWLTVSRTWPAGPAGSLRVPGSVCLCVYSDDRWVSGAVIAMFTVQSRTVSQMRVLTSSSGGSGSPERHTYCKKLNEGSV